LHGPSASGDVHAARPSSLRAGWSRCSLAAGTRRSVTESRLVTGRDACCGLRADFERVSVSENRADPGPAIAFDEQRSDPELSEERARIAALFEAEPDKELGLVAEMDFEEPEGPVVYVCAMHPEVVSDEPGSC
jgi:hypothetical protein